MPERAVDECGVSTVETRHQDLGSFTPWLVSQTDYQTTAIY